MFNKIVVPLDGSQLAERALAPAMALAQASRGQLILFRAPLREKLQLLEARDLLASGGLGAEEALQQARHQAQAYLDALVQQTSPAGFSIRPLMVEGAVADIIIDVAATEQADLIVISSHGYSGLTRWVMGSVTERVLHSAPCPVLVIHGLRAIRRVLIPLDGSRLSEQALGPGLALAASLGAEVILVRAIPRLDANEIEQLDNLRPGLGSTLEAELTAGARQYLRDLAAGWSAGRTPIRTQVLFGPPAEGILSFAETQACDVIAMSTHGRTGLRRWVYGSVTEKLLRTGRCSVLVVRSAALPGLLPAEALEPALAAVGHQPAESASALHVVSWPDDDPAGRPGEGPEAALERAFIAAYLYEKGYSPEAVQRLPEDARRRLMADASAHASVRLAEIEARAHLVHQLEGHPVSG